MSNSIVAAPDNAFLRRLHAVHSLHLPAGIEQRLVSFAAGKLVPYLATSAVRLEEVTAERAVLSMRNRRRVQNHMKSVHACAMVLLAEAATGTVLMANLPDRSLFSTTHIGVDYTQRAIGDLRATAELTAEQRELVRTQTKGKLAIPVMLTDAQGTQPARFTIEWSWKHRSQTSS
jgi:uncharacterized protein (TIGR00369 family)